MEFVLASRNANKLREMQSILADISLLPLPETAPEVEETGKTFAENAILKAASAASFTGLPAIADDSGLVVDALQGAPGIYSARYGGASCQTDEERNALLLKNMQGVKDRGARFVCVIALVYPDGTRILAEGICEGEITLAPCGEGGFGYDPIFHVTQAGKTFAELTDAQKNALSHRGKALAKFRKKVLGG